MTLAELDEIVRAARYESWDKVSILATYATNSAQRREPLIVHNPLDGPKRDYQLVELSDVPDFKD